MFKVQTVFEHENKYERIAAAASTRVRVVCCRRSSQPQSGNCPSAGYCEITYYIFLGSGLLKL